MNPYDEGLLNAGGNLAARDLTAIVVDTFVLNARIGDFALVASSPLGAETWTFDWVEMPDPAANFPYGFPVENP